MNTSLLLKAARWFAAALSLVLGPLAAHAEASRPIPDRYIVVFKAGVQDPQAESDVFVRSHGGHRHHVYSHALKGFAATLPPAAVQALRNSPMVELVEQDHTVSINGAQVSSSWGLDRIDQADRPLDNTYHWNYTGAGVTAFIIDTGIRSDHTEFAGRVAAGFTSVNDGNGTNDCNGHGTHVSGTVGGANYGVAKGVTLVPVRVLDCSGSGTWSGVIAGVDYVASSPLRPAVANMSLGGGLSTSLNSAVANAVAKGVTMVVAAGNDSANACNSSPSSEPSAITVGATTSADTKASYSNYGSCVDVFAPGSSITSSWNTSPTATNTISGTSMATPHVTGVAALALQAKPSASPAAVAAFITSRATPNRLSSIGTGSPNLLLYSLGAGVPTEPPATVVAVKSLASSTATSSTAWLARVTITVRNVSTGAVVPNVTVSGAFSPGNSVSCVTTSAGSCTVNSSTFSRASVAATVYTVNSLSASGMVYDATQNLAKQIQVNRP